MHAHLEAGYPHEACGILVGDIDGGQKTVKDVVLVENKWDTFNERESLANRFLIAPEDIARADRDAGKRGLDIIGFFHSHPDSSFAPQRNRPRICLASDRVCDRARAGRQGDDDAKLGVAR